MTHTKDEALKKALNDLIAEYHMETSSFAKRVDEIFEQALAAQPAPVQPMAHIMGEIDHTGKVWKPVQPAPVREPVATLFGSLPVYETPPVKEPVAWLVYAKGSRKYFTLTFDPNKVPEIYIGGEAVPLYTTLPAARPAIPDALTSADIEEHIEYVAGWNECRQAMMEMMK
jgi:hypothetical protein